MRKIIAKITLDNKIAVIQAHPESIEYLSKFFIVMDTSQCWQRGKFVKELAKPINFLTRSQNDPTGAMLPIGLLPTLEKILNKNKASYKIIDERKKEKFNFTDEEIAHVLENENNPIVLRDYQVEAVRTMLGVKNGTVRAGTGSGKSEIFSAWCKLTNKKALIAFKNIKLAREIVARMKKANIDIGLVQGNNVNENHQVVACTVQSAHKLNRTDYEAIIVDESHNSSQERYQSLLTQFDFEYRFGFSATPFNKKNKLKTFKAKSWLGDLIFDLPAKQLIDEGHLAKPIITFILVDKVIKEVIRKGEKVKQEAEIFDLQWQAAEKNGIVNNIYRNKIIKTLANNLEGTVLALVKYVESHGEVLHKEMNDALFLSGKDKIKERELAVEMLENNEIKTIIASTIFDEGISIDNISNVILCGGGQSYEKTLQRIGRGMRILKDDDGNVIKDVVKVYDFYDETHPILERHAKERIKFAEAEGYEVRIKKLKL